MGDVLKELIGVERDGNRFLRGVIERGGDSFKVGFQDPKDIASQLGRRLAVVVQIEMRAAPFAEVILDIEIALGLFQGARHVGIGMLLLRTRPFRDRIRQMIQAKIRPARQLGNVG